MTKNTGERDFLVGMPPENYFDGQTESMTDSTSKGWSAIGSAGRM